MKKIFDALIQNLELVSQQLSDAEVAEKSGAAESFNKDEFWRKMVDVTHRVSHEATKMCLMFSKPPIPDAGTCQTLCQSLEMACLSLISICNCEFPHQQGVTLRSQLQRCMSAVVNSVGCLIIDLRDCDPKGKNGQLQATGRIWDACEKLEHVPKDNKTAVLQLISAHNDLVEDALRELNEAINEATSAEHDEDDGAEDCETDDDDLGDKWKSSERDIARTALGLVKTAKSYTKKLSEIMTNKASATDFQQELDCIAVVVQRLSPVVDNFVLSLYPPMRKWMVMENAAVLSALLKELLDAFRTTHCFSSEDTSWYEFLYKAVDHNLAKVENVTGKSRLG